MAGSIKFQILNFKRKFKNGPNQYYKKTEFHKKESLLVVTAHKYKNRKKNLNIFMKIKNLLLLNHKLFAS